jgi:hypothetical protein
MKKIVPIAILLFITAAAFSQTTVFQHRGIVLDGAGPVNGNYDLILVLHEDQFAQTQVGNADAIPDVAIVNGVFTALVNFSTMPFTTRDKLYLEVRYSPVGSGAPYVSATNREPLLPSAFALRAHHATTAAFAQNADAVQGIYPVNIVQNNQSGSPQPGVSINVEGSVTGSSVNTTNGYDLGGQRILSSVGGNLYAGHNSGTNSAQYFLGNSFFGTNTGNRNGNGSSNSFFGYNSGANNLGNQNSFFGYHSGTHNVRGIGNAFVGTAAGNTNENGSRNVFVGADTAANTTSGDGNTFVGFSAGKTNYKDSFNTLVGHRSDTAKGVTNATAIGNLSRVDASNAVVLGSVAGANGADRTARVGIGTTSPQNALQVIDPDNTGLRVQTNKAGGRVASFGGNGVFQVDAPGVAGGRMTVQENGNVGLGTNTPATRLHVNGGVRVDNGGVRVDNGDILGLGGNGLVLKNRYGQCFRIEVNQSGQLVVTGMFCP